MKRLGVYFLTSDWKTGRHAPVMVHQGNDPGSRVIVVHALATLDPVVHLVGCG